MYGDWNFLRVRSMNSCAEWRLPATMMSKYPSGISRCRSKSDRGKAKARIRHQIAGNHLRSQQHRREQEEKKHRTCLRAGKEQQQSTVKPEIQRQSSKAWNATP